MTLKEAIQKDGQRHLYVKLAFTSGTIQYNFLLLFDSDKDYLVHVVNLFHFEIGKMKANR